MVAESGTIAPPPSKQTTGRHRSEWGYGWEWNLCRKFSIRGNPESGEIFNNKFSNSMIHEIQFDSERLFYLRILKSAPQAPPTMVGWKLLKAVRCLKFKNHHRGGNINSNDSPINQVHETFYCALCRERGGRGNRMWILNIIMILHPCILPLYPLPLPFTLHPQVIVSTGM